MNFLLTIKISYFSFFKYVKTSRSTVYPFLTSFSVLHFLPLLQLFECLTRYMCGHNFKMKFLPDFHNYTGLNELVNSFSSPLHLMCAITRAYASTRVTSLMRVKKKVRPTSLYDTYCLDIVMKKIKERSKISNWIVNHFSLIFC